MIPVKLFEIKVVCKVSGVTDDLKIGMCKILSLSSSLITFPYLRSLLQIVGIQ